MNKASFSAPLLIICLWILPRLGVFADGLYYGISENISGATESSSSKHQVAIFSSPLSTSIVTSDDITNMGATSIPEALRRVPGVLVREQTNGQYNVHIRGFENVPQGGDQSSLNNLNTLVMIDNRIVYDYFLGSIFWETLPISIQDIDRIEVIRGGATALYGPNAITGVIHIFTKRRQEDQQVDVRIQLGTQKTGIAMVSASHKIASSWLAISGYVEQRDRYQSDYYNFHNQQYQPIDEIDVALGLRRYPNPEQARDNSGLSVNLYNNPISLFAYELSYQYQSSEVQKSHHTNTDTPLTTNKSESDAFNIRLNYDQLYARVSHHRGKNSALGYPQLGYDFENTQAGLEYIYHAPTWYLRPGIRYNYLSYEGDFIGGQQHLQTVGYLLRSEYALSQQTRLIAALSYDNYNRPHDGYFNYQFLASHKIGYDTLARVGVEKANRSSFMVNSFLDLQFTLPNNPSLRSDFFGNKDIDLMSILTYEIGLRHNFNFYNWIDVELFHSTLDDTSDFIQQQPIVDGDQVVIGNTLEPIPTQAKQLGVTIDWHYEALSWKVNPFLTWQKTKIKNQTADLIAPLHFYNTDDTGTPALYGGVNANWQPWPRWQFNGNMYWMTSHTFKLRNDLGEKKTHGFGVVNFSVTHNPAHNWQLQASIKNLTQRKQSQQFHTDEIEPAGLISIHYHWH
ncbi:TonB-dependent receptor plug [Oleiphilus messinensis]|uniref:TonB-dependent receptor plug n=1 Tax=Oleiphilus messinensis TaxID=141451 RepID=A0A1Y0IB24_9GAMM|nr:TonB-dependent receptor [Oleiphilus messinensis]ARU57717.1 TonB-dependent receptor plug [Oleiphilus messinensis]